MQKQRQKKAFSEKRNAFSLMELMIVIVILGLLSALVLPNIMGKAEDAKQKLVCIQMKTLKEALDSFKFDNGTYPVRLALFQSLHDFRPMFVVLQHALFPLGQVEIIVGVNIFKDSLDY